MKKHKRNEQEFLNLAIRSIQKKKDCRIIGNKIHILSSKSRNRSNDIGNRVWGHIDGLTNHFGYTKLLTDKI